MKKSALLILALLTSCQKRGIDSASMFSKGGELKDKIACVSMIDTSQANTSWDVASELSSYLDKHLARKDTLYVIPVKNELNLSAQKNPFSSEFSWLNSHFSHMSYVVFTELLKYEKDQDNSNITNELSISVRVRVFKNTGTEFIVVLQEIMQETYMLPSLLTKTQFLQPSFQEPGYDLSPVGSSHQKFAELLASRIRDYIKD